MCRSADKNLVNTYELLGFLLNAMLFLMKIMENSIVCRLSNLKIDYPMGLFGRRPLRTVSAHFQWRRVVIVESVKVFPTGL